jgi:hypothetical protein
MHFEHLEISILGNVVSFSTGSQQILIGPINCALM